MSQLLLQSTSHARTSAMQNVRWHLVFSPPFTSVSLLLFQHSLLYARQDVVPTHLDKGQAANDSSHMMTFVDLGLLADATCFLSSRSGFSYTAWYWGHQPCHNTVAKCLESLFDGEAAGPDPPAAEKSEAHTVVAKLASSVASGRQTAGTSHTTLQERIKEFKTASQRAHQLITISKASRKPPQ